MIAAPNLTEVSQFGGGLASRLNKFIPHTPFPKQSVALAIHTRELFFGGSAGGGKSDFLLMAALQFVDRPEYRALILRRSFPALSLPGAIMDRALAWLAPWIASKEVGWHKAEKTLTFPSGAQLVFGFVQHSNDLLRYQGTNFHFISWDELTEFPDPNWYRFMYSRNRRARYDDIPLRVRSASTPGGPGHQWVKERLVDEKTRHSDEKTGARAVFVPSTLSDNIHLDTEEYESSLSYLDPVTRQRFLKGDWSVREPGELFDRLWFKQVPDDEVPLEGRGRTISVRYWDVASTKGGGSFTVGAKLIHPIDSSPPVYYLTDIVRGRWSAGKVEEIIKNTARRDGEDTLIRVEVVGGYGKHSDHTYQKLLSGYKYEGVIKREGKVESWMPLSAASERGEIVIVAGARWAGPLFDELEALPAEPNDQGDAASGAFNAIVAMTSGRPGAYNLKTQVGRDEKIAEAEAEAKQAKFDAMDDRDYCHSCEYIFADDKERRADACPVCLAAK